MATWKAQTVRDFFANIDEELMLGAGLTKIPIDGQPKSIVKELEDMARTYIKVRALHIRDHLCPATARAE